MTKINFCSLACLQNLQARLIFKVFLIIVITVILLNEQLYSQDKKIFTVDLNHDIEFLLSSNKRLINDTNECYIFRESYYVNTIIAYKNLGQKDSMSKYVSEFYNFSPISFWDRFCQIETSKFFKEIIDKDTVYNWKNKCKFVEQGFDSNLIIKIKLIEINDQKYRREIEEFNQTNADPRGKYISDLYKNQEKLDIYNQIFIDSLLTCCGYPGRDKIGIELEKVPFLVIQHSTIEKMEEYLPIIKKAIKDRRLSSDIEAYLVDRVKIGKNEKQIYGTQFFYNKKKKRMDIYPIEDMKNVDKRREKVGLYPLSRDIRNYGVKFD